MIYRVSGFSGAFGKRYFPHKCGRERAKQVVIEYDAVRWAETLLRELQRPLDTGFAQPSGTPTHPLQDHAASKFFEDQPGTKALFLDYDGTIEVF